MRPRSIPALLVATVALLAAGAVPALGATAGQTFLAGGLDLPAGSLGGAGYGGYAGDGADQVSVSRDGRYVAFSAMSDGLDTAANPDVGNVYRKDLLTGEVVLVSRATGAGGAVVDSTASNPVISADGSRVAFLTQSSLSPTDTDGGASDVYVRDIPTGITILASIGTGGVQTTDGVSGYDLSGDGQHVVFATRSALDGANDANAKEDVYERDFNRATTVLVSRRAGSAAAANGDSSSPTVSDDGVWVAFTSTAGDLVAGYSGSGTQAFARDTSISTNYLVSGRAGSATTAANGDASEPHVAGGAVGGSTASATVTFTSAATDGAMGDTDSATSIYTRIPGATSSTLVSRTAGGRDADHRSYWPSISDDGRLVTFTSEATNLGGGGPGFGVYVRDGGDNVTLLASTDNRYAVQSALAGDGSHVAWVNASGVTADSDPDLYGVFARSVAAATSTLGAPQFVSRPAGSAPFLGSAFEVGDTDAGSRAISADGRYVVFLAYSSHLPGAGPYAQIYRRDTLTGAIELVSRADGAAGAAANGYAAEPSISADGSRVAFVSAGTNLEGGTGTYSLVYVRDMAAGTTRLVSRADGAGGAVADNFAQSASISADGRHVTFRSDARDLGPDASGRWHVYLRDLAAGRTQLVDRATGAGGAIGNGDADKSQPSADGRYVVFGSTATNLDAADADTTRDLYVRDTVAGTTTLVSRQSGLGGAKATRTVSDGAISADGSTVAFEANDDALAPEAGRWGGNTEVVARTLATGANVLVSRVPGGAPANAGAYDPSVSGDGSVIAFDSRATNLLPGLGGGVREAVYARTMASGALSGPPAFGLVDNQPQDHALYPALSDDGQCMAFQARGHNAATGFAGDFNTEYVYVVSGQCPKPLPVTSSGSASVAKPSLTHVSLSNKRFRVGSRRTAVSAAKKRRARRAPVGTTIRFTLDTRANVGIAFERPAAGRLVGRSCRRATRALRRHRSCTLWVSAGRIARGGVRAGKGSIAFSGRIGRKALKPGSYRARVRASNAAGVSRWATLKFTIVR